ncbi:M20 family metallopeptidase [Streptomyces albipurpureus]|uniref:M20 family metallopeptidase n=1 Tax=Streptomyces albipurpureus TaxID=2897419 RepID=A0ABT0UUZ2_9ACTN|nr:M20 family metallopeptidase [Streptomyces sp. CWNU-1]MCM2392061.1 M20 family metallopeptidase [Streptomyces sp. CWNU-1]
MIADIERLVRCESPSDDLAAVARSAELVSRIGAGYLGVEAERIVIDGRTHLRWRFGSSPRVLLVGHHDTVWPIGSWGSHPFEVRDGVLRGPGCFDMKAGLVMAFHALAALAARSPGATPLTPGSPHPLDGVTLLITGDEEPGSTTSRELIEQEARQCAAALVLEAAGPAGALKTERKGVSRYEVLVRGRAAHSGLEPERGVNATVEAAHQILAVAALGDAARGTTVTPTRLEAGTTNNTVPASARFDVDVRVWDAAEQHRVHTSMRNLRAVVAGATVEVSGGPNRPPLSATASRDLFERAQRLAQGLGMRPLAQVAVGGASDGNLTAGVGTPTLDGLGAVGGGAHADDEHLLVAELPRRTELLTALVAELLAPQEGCPPGRNGDRHPVPADQLRGQNGWNHDRRD